MEEKEKNPNKHLRRERELKGWSQAKLAELLNTNEQSISRWESGFHKPSRHFQTKLCQIFEKSAEELGFMKEKQGLEESSKSHVSLANLALSFEQISSEVTSLAIPPNQEIASAFGDTIIYFWKLYYSGGVLLVEKLLDSFLLQLLPLTQQSSKYQKALASVSSQTYQLSWLIHLQHQNFGQALSAIKKALIYAELAQEPNLLLTSLVREAHTFFHLNNPTQQLLIHQKAMQYVDGASSLLKSYLYLVLAESHAPFHHEKEADYFLGLAKDIFPEKPEQDSNYSYVSIDHFWFANHEAITDLYLHRPKDAWSVLTRFSKNVSVLPRRVELTNRELMTLYALDDLQESCNHFELAIQSAKQSGSNLRYNEVCNMYIKMISKWPHEQNVRRLEEFLR